MNEQKNLEEMRKTIAEFRHSKYKEIKGYVNFTDFELYLNRECISLIDTHLLCDKDVAKILTDEMNESNQALMQVKADMARNQTPEHNQGVAGAPLAGMSNSTFGAAGLPIVGMGMSNTMFGTMLGREDLVPGFGLSQDKPEAKPERGCGKALERVCSYFRRAK